MNNIPIIDGSESTADREFDLIFPNGQDIAFSDEVWKREWKVFLEAVLAKILNDQSASKFW